MLHFKFGSANFYYIILFLPQKMTFGKFSEMNKEWLQENKQ